MHVSLAAIASPIAPSQLPIYGVGRQPQREHECQYYVLRATPIGIEERKTNQLIEFVSFEGDHFLATAPMLPEGLRGRSCLGVFVTHAPLPGQTRMHVHLLKLRPCGPPVANRVAGFKAA